MFDFLLRAVEDGSDHQFLKIPTELITFVLRGNKHQVDYQFLWHFFPLSDSMGKSIDIADTSAVCIFFKFFVLFFSL